MDMNTSQGRRREWNRQMDEHKSVNRDPYIAHMDQKIN